MENFFKSFLPIIKRLKKFKIEIIILSIAVFTAFISLVIYIKTSQQNEELIENFSDSEKILPAKKIFVDIAGAIEKPDVYEITNGARLKDVLILAGGLSAEADRQFFSRNFNLSRILKDQEKIYIPSKIEIYNGLFIENPQNISLLQPVDFLPNDAANQKKLININSATIEELDQLPGIGKITAEKIIKNRPYQTIEELLNKKIVKKNVWEKIKNLISID